MIKIINRMALFIVAAVTASLIGLFAPSSYARCLQLPQEPETKQPGFVADPIRELNLTPEQREKIRALREQTRQERIAINQRLRETNRALDEALDSDNPDEALIEQRLSDFAAAQAASMRLRVLNEVRIRKVLTVEQLTMLRELRRQARAQRRLRQLDSLEERRQQGMQRPNRVPNQRTLPRALFPHRRNLP